MGMLDKMMCEKLLNMAWHVARPWRYYDCQDCWLGGWAAEPAAADPVVFGSLYSGPCGCGGGKAALLSSSGYQLLKAAGGTAEYEGACPCFGDWCFQLPGWRGAQRGDIELQGDREATSNEVQKGSSRNAGAGLKGRAGGSGRQRGERGRERTGTCHLPGT